VRQQSLSKGAIDRESNRKHALSEDVVAASVRASLLRFVGSITSLHEETYEIVHRRADLRFSVTFDKQIQWWELALARSLARCVIIAFGGNGDSGVVENLRNVRTIGDGPLLQISISCSEEEGRRAWIETTIGVIGEGGKVLILAPVNRARE
jgi:hypothetical protein